MCGLSPTKFSGVLVAKDLSGASQMWVNPRVHSYALPHPSIFTQIAMAAFQPDKQTHRSILFIVALKELGLRDTLAASNRNNITWSMTISIFKSPC